jgi:hypothetical protein
VRVTVRVEKLELGPGGVGVEIERRRASEKPAQKPGSQPESTQDTVPERGKKGLIR